MHSNPTHKATAARIDHLVVTAPDLAKGVAWVEEKLGVTMQQGGRHVTMGTHNCLLKLGPACYLEVIAIDPAAAAPAHPRWFGLDTLTADSPPALRTWVAATNHLETTLLSAAAGLCTITPMQRGAYSWKIALPANGKLLFDGIAPLWITWTGDNHPCNVLPDQGCTLTALEGFHPRSAIIQQQLADNHVEGNIIMYTHPVPALSATIQTPSGLKNI